MLINENGISYIKKLKDSSRTMVNRMDIESLFTKREGKGRLCEAMKKLSRENPYEFFPVFTKDEQQIMQNISIVADYEYRREFVGNTLDGQYKENDKAVMHYINNHAATTLISRVSIDLTEEYFECLHIRGPRFSSNTILVKHLASHAFSSNDARQKPHKDISQACKHDDIGSNVYGYAKHGNTVSVLLPIVGDPTWFFPFSQALYQANLYEAWDNDHALKDNIKISETVDPWVADIKEQNGEYQQIPFGYACVFISGLMGAVHAEPINKQLLPRLLMRINCLEGIECSFKLKEPLELELIEREFNNSFDLGYVDTIGDIKD